MLILRKAVTALIDWLLVFAVYVVCAKSLGKRTGFLASAVLLCFPLFERNAWGGYTSLLIIAFIALLLMYLALPLKGVGQLIFAQGIPIALQHQQPTIATIQMFASTYEYFGKQPQTT
jgi:hypothetical protein